MKSPKNIFFSFDYELFLGKKSGTVMNCMLKPTSLLIEILEKHNIKGIFFVDFTYLSILEKKNTTATQTDFERIIQQLTELAEKGHYIFPHLHPHWLDAKYNKNENQWDLSNLTRYTLNALDDKTLEALFDASFKYMKMIYKDKLPDVIGYRAGGLFIQPFKKIKQHFLKHSIAFDSSVLPNRKKTFEFGSYNYAEIQTSSPYFFSDEVTEQHKKGIFIEMPITTIQLNLKNKILNSIYFRWVQKRQSPFGDGTATRFNVSNTKKANRWYSYFLHSDSETCSIELFNPIKTKLIYQLLKKQEYIMVLSHPKLINTKQLNDLDKLIIKIKKRYTINTNPITYIYNLKQIL